MENINFPIPEVKFIEDFTIIYKGKDEEADNKEKIIEIKTSKEELIRRLRYFKNKSDEIKHINEYYIHDEFSTTIFNDFISSLKTKTIAINEQNYSDYSKLSSKYEYYEIQEILAQFLKRRPDLQIILEKLSQNQNENEIETEKEKIIAQNLDFCLEHGNLSTLPISMLNRIFHSPERILKNHHLLFNFIKQKINQLNQSEEVEILISSLDYNEMSIEEIEEFLNFEGIGEIFNPRNSKQMMKSIFDSNKQLQIRIEKHENEFLIFKKKRDEEKIEFIEKLNKLSQFDEKIESDFLNEKKKRDEERREFTEKLNKLSQFNERIESDFLNEKKKRDEERKEFLDSLNKFKEFEEKLEIQNKILKKCQEEIGQLKSKPVSSIKINSEIKDSGKIILLNAIVKPQDATNKGVNWTVNEEVKKSVEIISQNDTTLILKVLKFGNKVSINAAASDGSGVTSSKEINRKLVFTEIIANVDQSQAIQGTIKIKEEHAELDKSKSKYILNENSSSSLGEDAYKFGSSIESLENHFTFNKSKGTYYIHALIIDNFNSSYEIVSNSITVNNTVPLTYDYTGKSKSIELESGKYKLEVWGAEGGQSYYKTQRLGGKGGYSVGTIELQSKTKLFVYVGGQGVGQKTKGKVEGGFNGGGYNADTRDDYTKGVGGGGTDIRIKTDSLHSRVIVAGGGGGGNGASSGGPSNGGVGGGTNGGIGSQHEYSISDASPGTQTSGGKPGEKNYCSEFLEPAGILIATGTFGFGGSVSSEVDNTMAGAGGGGWYGGGAGNGHGGSGSGGSGWIFTESNFNEWKRGNSSDADKFSLDSQFYLKDAETIAGNKSFPNITSTSLEEGHSGNGYAKITPL